MSINSILTRSQQWHTFAVEYTTVPIRTTTPHQTLLRWRLCISHGGSLLRAKLVASSGSTLLEQDRMREESAATTTTHLLLTSGVIPVVNTAYAKQKHINCEKHESARSTSM